MGLHINRVAFLIFLLFSFAFSSCNVARYVYWNFADVSDYRKFPADTISPAFAPKAFSYSAEEAKLHIPDNIRLKYKTGSSDEVFDKTHTLAFIVIKKDTVVFEKYFRGYDKSHVIPSFSVSKSFVSALIGIAVSEGYIKNIHDPVAKYLPEMKDKGFKEVTIEDLLTMRSGISFNEGYADPFGDAAKFYYGLNLRKYTLNLKVVTKPGTEYQYASGNTEILAMILEKATGKRLSEYMGDKIWKPMGAAYPATWSLDSKKYREVKAFCCINAVPEDFARFGELYLKKGKVGGNQVVPSEWIDETLDYKGDSKDSQGYPYTYHWRVMKNGSFFAKGILGQIIFICPQKQTVIVRMGAKSGGINWPAFLQSICDHFQ